MPPLASASSLSVVRRLGLSVLAAPAALAAIALAVSGPLASGAGTTPQPILAGPWSLNQEGYGHAKPTSISNGGDPTGIVRHIEWLTWGGSRAVGVGMGFYVGPNQIVAEATPQAAVVVLFKLGSCRHRRAYDAVGWYYPEHGEHFSARRYINACTGRYSE